VTPALRRLLKAGLRSLDFSQTRGKIDRKTQATQTLPKLRSAADSNAPYRKCFGLDRGSGSTYAGPTRRCRCSGRFCQERTARTAFSASSKPASINCSSIPTLMRS